MASPDKKLVDDLAEITGRKQALVERLRRHATKCSVPRLREALERISAEEVRHVRTLTRILNDHHVWAKMPELPAHDGANNWERVSNDLELLSQLSLALGRQMLHWEAVNSEIAGEISTVISEDSLLLRQLREVAAKFDPQAFD